MPWCISPAWTPRTPPKPRPACGARRDSCARGLPSAPRCSPRPSCASRTTNRSNEGRGGRGGWGGIPALAACQAPQDVHHARAALHVRRIDRTRRAAVAADRRRLRHGQRAVSRRLDAALLLDKPVGLSSNAALQAAKRLVRAAKAGHAGTLDPLASGLLVVLFGEATKFAGTLLAQDKEYVATLKLGETTATGEAEGEVLERRPVDIGR